MIQCYGMYKMDNATICGHTLEEHDQNLLLCYCISHNSLQTDPHHLTPLLNLPPPADPKSLKRIIGMFSYYVKWIYEFSDKKC